eukprot:scaffold34610_cov197-Amphora_coffeaeformis.AAC.5
MAWASVHHMPIATVATVPKSMATTKEILVLAHWEQHDLNVSTPSKLQISPCAGSFESVSTPLSHVSAQSGLSLIHWTKSLNSERQPSSLDAQQP